MKNYRLGIDLGSTSLGWALLELDNNNKIIKTVDMGVRIFPDGRDNKTKEPLNVTRRLKRQARKQHDRYLQRKKLLIRSLVEYGLMPNNIKDRKQLQHLDPYKLRAEALDNKLTLYQLGRAIFHINQRRGFKSNRKIDAGDKDAGKIKEGIKNLKKFLDKNNFRTLGEYQYSINKNLPNNKQHKKQSIRFKTDENNYEFFPERGIIEDEFDKIWDKQVEFHPELSTVLKEQIKKAIFYQRDLKPQEKGKCTLIPSEPRINAADPYFQQFRLLQIINNLELLDYYRHPHELTTEQRETILEKAQKQKTVSYKSLRKILGEKYLTDYEFNYEKNKNDKIKSDETSYLLRKKEYFGKLWDALDLETQSEIVTMILNPENNPEIEKELPKMLNDKFSLSEKNVQNIIKSNLNKSIANLSKKAIKMILPYLEKGLKYDKACKKAGLDHALDYTGEIYDEGNLPYYGELLQRHVLFGDKENYTPAEPEKYYGKITNPTVHIALNQLRKLINEICRTYGAPKQIVLELARELKVGRKRLDEINKKQQDNRKNNERIAQELEKLGIANNYDNRTKYKLWEELSDDPLQRCCPFSGKQISETELFNNKFQIEHILPKSRTFDDRFANKTIAHFKANQQKGERSPYEAFSHNPAGYEWNEILARAEKLPAFKKWRFYPDAMEKFGEKNEVISRLLNDTKYMSRIAKLYMNYVAGIDNVWVIPGALTAKFRHYWGLNSLLSEDDEKNRGDHRHHCIDAFVVACTDRSLLKRYMDSIKKSNHKFIEKMPKPYHDYFDRLQEILNKMIISFKPDHGNAPRAVKNNQTVGALYKDTAYGYDGEYKKDQILLTVRKTITGFENQEQIAKIKDKNIREELLEITQNASKKELKEILQNYGENNNIKKVKIYEHKKPKNVEKIADKKNNYKYLAFGENYCADIYCPSKGKKKGKWQCQIIPMPHAHQKNFVPKWQKKHPTAKKLMRLFKKDYVAYEKEGKLLIKKIQKITKNHIFLIDPLIVNASKENWWEASAKQLQECKARKVGVDILGRVADPGYADSRNK